MRAVARAGSKLRRFEGFKVGELFEVQSCEGSCFGRSAFGLYATCRIVFDGVESTEAQVFGLGRPLEGDPS